MVRNTAFLSVFCCCHNLGTQLFHERSKKQNTSTKLNIPKIAAVCSLCSCSCYVCGTDGKLFVVSLSLDTDDPREKVKTLG